MQPRRVLTVDDHPVVLRGIGDLIAHTDAFAVVGTAQSRAEAIEAARALQPDLITLDLRLGADLAPDVIGELSDAARSARIVILTAFDDGDLLRLCLDRGASAVLLKDASGLDLITAFERVMDGEAVIDPRLNSRALKAGESARYREAGVQRLSDREYEVLRLLARGLNTREIARELALMPNTVRSYVQTVLGKLQSRNRVMAIATARRLRLI